MAEQEAKAADAPATDANDGKGDGLGAKGKLMALAFVLFVVLMECAIAVLVFPSAQDTEAMAQAMLAHQDSTDPLVVEPGDLEESGDQKREEVDLGEFDVSSYQPLSNTTIRINLHLWGTVLTDDKEEVLQRIEERQQRMREQILVTLRSAEVTDLADANLGLIKRRILEKTNRTFGKPLLQQIVFSEFSFFEQ
ncbi:MAG: hypothetical protein ACC645_05705 [Pirellulales bacterium]